MRQIFHTWDKWECYRAGFYESRPTGRNISEGMCKHLYARFLRDIPRFEKAMDGVLNDWPNSAEHYLSNERMNRIAWLGQAAMCHETGIPAVFCGGYNLLTMRERAAADLTALNRLNRWLTQRGEPTIGLSEAGAAAEYHVVGKGNLP